MKIRIKGNSVRLRLTQSEVKTFAATGLVTEKTYFSPANVLTYAVKAAPVAELSATFEQNTVTVLMPTAAAKKWTETEQVGTENLFSTGSDTLKILVEKDFSCLVVRPGEDDADAFPHPKKA